MTKSIPSYEKCLEAGKEISYYPLGNYQLDGRLRVSSMTWTDEQRIEFLKTCIHNISNSGFHFGENTRVLRIAAMRGNRIRSHAKMAEYSHLSSLLVTLTGMAYVSRQTSHVEKDIRNLYETPVNNYITITHRWFLL